MLTLRGEHFYLGPPPFCGHRGVAQDSEEAGESSSNPAVLVVFGHSRAAADACNDQKYLVLLFGSLRAPAPR